MCTRCFSYFQAKVIECVRRYFSTFHLVQSSLTFRYISLHTVKYINDSRYVLVQSDRFKRCSIYPVRKSAFNEPENTAYLTRTKLYSVTRQPRVAAFQCKCTCFCVFSIIAIEVYQCLKFCFSLGNVHICWLLHSSNIDMSGT